ncbi:MAG: hypothetical protein V9H69_11340 [Anaerolineae bacterium]
MAGGALSLGQHQAVDHLVDGAIAAGRHDQIPASQRGALGQLNGVAAIFRHHQFVDNARGLQGRLHLMRAFVAAPAASLGVEDDKSVMRHRL